MLASKKQPTVRQNTVRRDITRKGAARQPAIWLLFFVVYLFVAGCWSPKKESSRAVRSVSSFYVTSVDGRSTGHEVVSKTWNIPGEKSFRFSACLEDTMNRRRLINQKFVVESHDHVRPFSTPVVSFDNGCIFWRETNISFDYFAPSKYLVFRRTIRAASDSVHRGNVEIKFLVNPWASYRAAKGYKVDEVIWWPEDTQLPIDESKIVDGALEVRQALQGMNVKESEKGKLFLQNVSLLSTKLADVYLAGGQNQVEANNGAASSENSDQSRTSGGQSGVQTTLLADEPLSGFDMEIHMEATPVVQIENINGDIVQLEVPAGKFRVFAELVATNLGDEANKNLILTGDKSNYGKPDDKINILTSMTPHIESEMHMGRLRPIVQATVSRRVTEARLKLALMVRPIDSPSNLAPYEGLYVIGDHRRLMGTSVPKLDMDTYFSGNRQFKFFEYLQKSEDFETLRGTYAVNMRPFDFSLASGVYDMVLPGETATQRTIAFRVETCVFDNATGTGRLQFKQFEIYRDGVKLPAEDSRTNEEGCLVMLGKVSHAFYKIEELKPTIFEIYYNAPNLVARQNGQTTSGKGKHTLTVYTNPWDDKFTFFRDERRMSREFKEIIADQRKIESRFFISNFSYQTLRFGYEIDKFLNLTVEKSVLLKMEPYVLRYSGNVPGRNNIQRLRDGLYLLKVGYQKDYLDPATKGVRVVRKKRPQENGDDLDIFVAELWDPNLGVFRDFTEDERRHKTKQHLSVVKKLVRVNNGNIITPITLQVHDLRLMRVRSQLLIQLEPVDERLVQVANAYDRRKSEQIYERVSDEFKSLLEAHNRDSRGEVDEALTRYKEAMDAYEAKQAELIRNRILDHEKQLSQEPGYVPLTEVQIQQFIQRELESRRGEFEAYLAEFNVDLTKLDIARAQFNVLPDNQKIEIKEEIKKQQSELEALLRKLADDKLTPAQKQALVKIGVDPSGRRVVDTMAFSGTEYEGMDRFRPLLEEVDIYDETMDILKANDFTLSSAQALVENLDILVEPFEVSGLKKRTFIGPLTFLLNSNHSSVRPTDNIDENFCRTDDCDNFKSWGLTSKGLFLEEDVPRIKDLQEELNREGITAPERSAIKREIEKLENESIQRLSRNKKYYSSVNHFRNKHVDDMIPVWFESLKRREREFTVRSNISNFTNLYGLEFVSLKDEKLLEPRENCSSIYHPDFDKECLAENDKHTVPIDNFIDTFNNLPHDEAGMDLYNRAFSFAKGGGFDRYKLTREDLKEMIVTGKMKPEIAHGFCGIFVRQLVVGSSREALRPELSLKNIVQSGKAIARDYSWYDKNIKEINKLKTECFSRVRSAELPPFTLDRKIRIHSLQGERPVFRGGKQMNVNVGAGQTFGRDDRFSINTGLNAAAGGRFFGQFISDATGLLKLGADINASKGRQSTTSIQNATFLVMQSAAFDLKLKDYEQCVVINWNKEVFKEGFWHQFFFGSFSSLGRDIYIPGGYFLCAGREEEPQPIYVREHYFYFTQHFTDGDMLDHGDLYNHPWLLGLRGTRDGAVFIDSLSNEDYVMVDLTTRSNNHALWPIRKMIDSYLHVTPSFPGVHTLVDHYGDDYPWNELPEDSYRRIQEETLDANYGKTILGLPGYDEMMSEAEKREQDYSEQYRGNIRGRQDFIQDYQSGGNPPLRQ